MRKSKFWLSLLLIPFCLLLWSCSDNDHNSSGDSSEEITKAEAVAAISDYFGWPHPDDYNDYWKDQVERKTFNDVETTDEFGKQIEVAYEEGIITADSDGNFNPESSLTYGEAIAILTEAYKLPEETITPYVVANYSAEDSERVVAKEDFDSIFDTLKNTFVAPPYAVPMQDYAAPRRYVKMYTATPEATIYYTTDGSDPVAGESEVYSVYDDGHINHSLPFMLNEDTDEYFTYRAITVKEGMAPSTIQEFTWHLHRLASSDYGSELILDGTDSSPTIYQLYNNGEALRPMAWYIEGSEKAIVYDALMTPATEGNPNLATYVRENLLPEGKELIVVIGHEHGDHDAQAPNFLDAGYEVYFNERGWSGKTALTFFGAGYPDPADQALIKNVDEGDSFDLGNCTFDVYALPGHADALIILQDKENGLIFASDIYGCTRAGSADNVNVSVSGLKVDMLLSFAQQTYANYKKDNGKTTMLFTGHDESALSDNNLQLFEAALQQVIDYGEEACSPTLRGGNDAPYSRTTLIGDMWNDGTNWIALKIGGIMGDDFEYLTNSPVNADGETTNINYNTDLSAPDAEQGFMKYSVLSNIEIEGGELVGVDVSWAAPDVFTWGDPQTELTVEKLLPNKFDPWTYDYVITVPEENSSITIVPVTMSTRVQSITLNGAAVAYRSSNTINVNDGSIITIDIVAPDNETTSSYTFTIEKY